MASCRRPLVVLALFLSCLTNVVALVSNSGPHRSTYIVHASKLSKPAPFASHADWYTSTLAAVKGLQTEEVTGEQHGLLYVYDTVFDGFAAQLTEEEAAAIEKVDGFVTAIPETVAQLHTTRSPEFLGLRSDEGLWPASGYGEGVIIGMMDTGVWPERKSFNDEMMGGVPERWKGECEFSSALCNKKLIGARSFYKGYEASAGPINDTLESRSPRDTVGHGTHTSSTAAGSQAAHANLFGSASGIASGMAPHAHLAIYKTCWASGCFSSDILAAFDRAVVDGVDVISASIGSAALPYFMDPLAMASFGAVAKGVVVACSAGNDGPLPQSVGNVAPWILTVAASTLDRDFPAIVQLGNDAMYKGVSLYKGTPPPSKVPLIYAADVSSDVTSSSAGFCMRGSLPPTVAGKIVICDRGITGRIAKGMVVKLAGGIAMILANSETNGNDLLVDSHVLPVIAVGYHDGLAIKDYAARSIHPTVALLFHGTTLGVKPAPMIAAFSARGPNPLNPEILKPDVTAPGVNILAAWTGEVGPADVTEDNRFVDFNILSGTSMSCPHVSGLVALLKGAHPKWSPAGIKSALMTTTTTNDNTHHDIIDAYNSSFSSPFCYGSGHVNPSQAINPGLIYDLDIQDYVDFLCSLNYSTNMLETLTKGQYHCSKTTFQINDFNYPSLSLIFTQDESSSKYTSSFTRTLTNVGRSNSIYKVTSLAPYGIALSVEPTILSFTQINQRRSYRVTFEASSKNLNSLGGFTSFGFLLWSDGVYKVRTPIVFTWQKPQL